MSDTKSFPANRLTGETSPYLLQHAHNPVDWFPWGPEALARSKQEDKPIFLSIGYSACHWCHVMERESFENPDIAALMNAHYINIKVDREERPDLDNIYMAAVQAMTGHGGWPMSVFLTPDLEPFYGGTYYPPTDSRGMPGFPRVLLSVNRAWQERRGEITNAAGEMTEQLKTAGSIPKSDGELEAKLLDNATRALGRAYEPIHGGFGASPKFPHPMDLRVLLRQHARTGDAHALHMVTHTLEKMARGGIYDHLGGGFARYSTDERWLVPHFEKMLYDNALLSSVYLEAYQLTAEPLFAQVARETMDYILGRMTSGEGPFYSTEDADSEGVEGKFYVWSLEEVISLLGDDRAKTFALVYDVTERGNWEHASILNMPRPLNQVARELGRSPEELATDLKRDRATLLEARERRIPPGKDTKVLTSWNGLMIAALAEGALILDEPRYAESASKAAGFLLDTMVGPDGRLLHSFKDGQAKFNGYLDDYANLVDGLIRLYESTGATRWLSASVKLAEVMIDEFLDAQDGGFFYVGKSHESLIVRQKDVYDNATPSGNAMAATALFRLGALTGRADFSTIAQQTLQSIRLVLDRASTAVGQSLVALDWMLAPTEEFAVFEGQDPAEFRQALVDISRTFRPHKVVVQGRSPGTDSAGISPLLADRKAIDGRLTTYVCRGTTCLAPLVGLEAIEAELQSKA